MDLSPYFAASASTRELVLPLPQALSVVSLLQTSGAELLGWEGWLRYSSGALGHSTNHQGTAALAGTANDVAALIKSTMQQSDDEHNLNPEVPGSELLFCITFRA